ncbi:MAG TPA: hypothetical protein VKZ53_31925 [Candidatus Angelobacter sp.]|nr:hypothetical protein [Candidatus Angelobacter sp.]
MAIGGHNGLQVASSSVLGLGITFISGIQAIGTDIRAFVTMDSVDFMKVDVGSAGLMATTGDSMVATVGSVGSVKIVASMALSVHLAATGDRSIVVGAAGTAVVKGIALVEADSTRGGNLTRILELIETTTQGCAEAGGHGIPTDRFLYNSPGL